MNALTSEASLQLLKQQRSHALFVLSEPRQDKVAKFTDWFVGAYKDLPKGVRGVLKAQHYRRHEFDVSQGQFDLLPYRYLAIYEISVDGAEAAGAVIDAFGKLYADHGSQPPATWLYYPVCEKVGRAPTMSPSMLTLAFANPVAGHLAEFREWYATRHIRHALNIPALVSGQCFQRTLFQKPGALAAKFDTIAVYEQEDTPQSIVESFQSIPLSTFAFPTLDITRTHFSESTFEPV